MVITVLQKVLIPGARFPFTLSMARLFADQGCEVHVTDNCYLTICRFSKAVDRLHHTPSPSRDPNGFINRILEIVEDEGITLVVPTLEEIFPLSLALDQFPDTCTVLCDEFDKLRVLHDKWLFHQRLQEHGYATPEAHVITDVNQLQQLSDDKRYALKPCYSRASQEVFCYHKAQGTPSVEMSEQKPWLAQEWLVGQRFCSYSVAFKGRLTAHVAYPVTYALDGHSCLTFEAVEHPEILQWVEKLVELENFTGQIAFDFVQPTPDQLYAFECNPRTELGIHLFRHDDGMINAMTGNVQEPLTPDLGRQNQLMIGMLLYGWRCPYAREQKERWKQYFKTLNLQEDTIYHHTDRLPFFLMPLVFTKAIARSLWTGTSIPGVFTADYEWNGDHCDISV